MNPKKYTASRTRTNRPGWSVTFRHPRRKDSRGQFGLRVRRGLGTTEDAKADELIQQLKELLADQSWWAIDRRQEASLKFDNIIVKAFFDGMETGKINSRELREDMLPLPDKTKGYARVMLVGSTGAGKTTLLRQLIGSDHTRDRFPSTSTAKTTTADIEIITTPIGPFKSAITFMNEQEVRGAVDECLEEACASVIRGQDDAGIAGALLEHPEQRFRLSYPLGSWQQESTAEDMDFLFEDDERDMAQLTQEEVVPDAELTLNTVNLREYVRRIKELAIEVQEQESPELGSYQDMQDASQRQVWLEKYIDALYDHQGFAKISLDIMDDIKGRFEKIATGDFEDEAIGWPTLWYYEESDRETFLHQVRWFTGNHSQQFGRLLTPLVDGIRVSGPFQPAVPGLQDPPRRLVLLDGEGLGHSAREATSISTKVTERFKDVDMILLIDNAQSPMQAAPLELLRSVGTSGHGHKLGVVFTHFDQVRGDNLSSYSKKVDHVYASIGNALSSMRDSLGAPVTEILQNQMEKHSYYLANLDRSTSRIPRGYVSKMSELLDAMQASGKPLAPPVAAPSYNVFRLELALRDATDGFKGPWRGRLGLSFHNGTRKEHWARVKALCRRIANRWTNEYGHLRPVADLIRHLQDGISLWLDSPDGWTRHPDTEEERDSAINKIRQEVSIGIHDLSAQRVIGSHQPDWLTAYSFRGAGSSYKRADKLASIYEAAAPSISSVMASSTQQFLDEIIDIVKSAVEGIGGSVATLKKTD